MSLLFNHNSRESTNNLGPTNASVSNNLTTNYTFGNESVTNSASFTIARTDLNGDKIYTTQASFLKTYSKSNVKYLDFMISGNYNTGDNVKNTSLITGFNYSPVFFLKRKMILTFQLQL